MSNLTIQAWEAHEKNSLMDFKPEIASRLEEAWCKALTEDMRIQMHKEGVAEVALPWGTYTAEYKDKGDTANITPVWHPSKGFMKLLNGDEEGKDLILQDTFDDKFEELFQAYTAYGFLYPHSEENKNNIPKNKGLMLRDDEVVYLLNSYAVVLANLAKDHQQNGKIFVLEINNGFPHGQFRFEYDDNEISVTFQADKVFKQLLKDDEAALKAKYADFHPVKEGEKKTHIVPATDMNYTSEDREKEGEVELEVA